MSKRCMLNRELERCCPLSCSKQGIWLSEAGWGYPSSPEHLHAFGSDHASGWRSSCIAEVG
jgi:hypothetical protein